MSDKPAARPVMGRWFEDMPEGTIIDHAVTRTITEADNTLFSVLTMNAQPLHLDEAFAAETEFGTRVVNSLFTLSLLIGLSVFETTLGTTVANLGFEEIAFPTPVIPGDTIRAQTEVVSARASSSRPTQGIVGFEHRAQGTVRRDARPLAQAELQVVDRRRCRPHHRQGARMLTVADDRDTRPRDRQHLDTQPQKAVDGQLTVDAGKDPRDPSESIPVHGTYVSPTIGPAGVLGSGTRSVPLATAGPTTRRGGGQTSYHPTNAAFTPRQGQDRSASPLPPVPLLLPAGWARGAGHPAGSRPRPCAVERHRAFHHARCPAMNDARRWRVQRLLRPGSARSGAGSNRNRLHSHRHHLPTIRPSPGSRETGLETDTVAVRSRSPQLAERYRTRRRGPANQRSSRTAVARAARGGR